MEKMSLNNEIFNNENAARAYLESMRWPNGPVCPHCGNVDKNYALKGEKHRVGLYKCSKCRKQFSVTVGTVFEKSKVPIHKWMLATFLLCSSKKGYSSHQLHRTLGVTYKTAWFMAHRIREAMKDNYYSDDKLGGGGSVVEVDETFWGTKKKGEIRERGWGHQQKILSLVERGGRVRSFHVSHVSAKVLKPIIKEQIKEDTHIFTDDWRAYRAVQNDFLSHEVVKHSKKEYSRGPINTNTVEGYFSILKRGMTGVYQHCDPEHLRRYVREFDFRYNHSDINDVQRMGEALKQIEGKRLVYMS